MTIVDPGHKIQPFPLMLGCVIAIRIVWGVYARTLLTPDNHSYTLKFLLGNATSAISSSMATLMQPKHSMRLISHQCICRGAKIVSDRARQHQELQFGHGLSYSVVQLAEQPACQGNSSISPSCTWARVLEPQPKLETTCCSCVKAT